MTQPKDSIYRGDLIITSKAQAKQYEHIAEVAGSIYISADVQLPVLTSVGGSLYIRADAQLPVLTSVGGVEISMRPLAILGLQWPITILDRTMRIGCQEHSLDDWASFDDRKIAEMDWHNAVKFWALHKASILGAARDAGRVFGVEVAA